MDASYPHALRDLLAAKPVQPLGPGQPLTEKHEALRTFSLAEAVKPRPIVDEQAVQACRAGLCLAFNFLNESHGLSQDLDTAEGSYWHAILHRREPDYWNGKYWFRRVGRHPIFDELGREAACITEERTCPAPAIYLLSQPTWDPFAFVDLCEKASHGPAMLESLCVEVQNREWELLFAYCYRRALGEN
jgi:hypothetical protein